MSCSMSASSWLMRASSSFWRSSSGARLAAMPTVWGIRIKPRQWVADDLSMSPDKDHRLTCTEPLMFLRKGDARLAAMLPTELSPSGSIDSGPRTHCTQHPCLAGAGQNVPDSAMNVRYQHCTTTSFDQATQLRSPQPSRTCWLCLRVKTIVEKTGAALSGPHQAIARPLLQDAVMKALKCLSNSCGARTAAD